MLTRGIRQLRMFGERAYPGGPQCCGDDALVALKSVQAIDQSNQSNQGGALRRNWHRGIPTESYNYTPLPGCASMDS